MRRNVHDGRDLGVNFKHLALKLHNFGINFKAVLKLVVPTQFTAPHPVAAASDAN